MTYAETFDKWPGEFRNGPVEHHPVDRCTEFEGMLRLDGDDLVLYRDRDPIWRMTVGPQTQAYLLRALAENISRKNAQALSEWRDREVRLEGQYPTARPSGA